MANKLFKKVNGVLTPVKFYKKTGSGLEVCPVYLKTSTGMERIDQTLVTKTRTFTGYADWCGSYRNSTGTGTANSNYDTEAKKNSLYQGKYGNYCHLGICSFKTLFQQIREFGGTITSIKLRLKNNHAYSSLGLNTTICGAFNLPDSRPTSFSFNNVNTKVYSNTEHFDRYATKEITLLNNVYSDIINSNIEGFRLLSPTGFNLTNYGYFEGLSSTERPRLQVTVSYQEYE